MLASSAPGGARYSVPDGTEYGYVFKSKVMSMLLDKVKALDIDERFPVISLYTYGEENVATLEEKAAALGICVVTK